MAEEAGDAPRPTSTPVLPPLSPAPAGTQPPPAQRAAMRRAAQRQAKRSQQNPNEGNMRQAFLGGLLNEDLQNLSKFHGGRPAHEQKRFLRSVDNLYKAFVSAEGGGGLATLQAKAEAEARARQEQQAAAMASAAREAAQDDPYNRPPSPTRAQLAASASAPSLPSRPIDVFEQRKRKGMGRRRGSSASQDGSSIHSSEMNGLERWLDAQSISSSTTGAISSAQFTTLSQMTRTSSGGFSLCSEPGTMNQAAYRHHKRALAANGRGHGVDHHAPGYLKDGIPTIGFPEQERMMTQFRDAYGTKPLAENITKTMYENVFKGDQLPFVDKYVESAPKEHRDQFANMVRSLQYLRTAKKRNTTTLQRQELDLEENSRLWKPGLQKPVYLPEQRNFSRIPLGSVATGSENAKPPTPSPPQTASEQRVHSPAVSDLCSLPLTPHSLPTPLVAGRDMPLATAPLQTIPESPQVMVT